MIRSNENKGYHKLIVWKKAREFVKLIYLHTNHFPSSEEFGLKSQIRRATVSIVLNIVEGYRRSSKKEFLHFLNTSETSLAEVEATLELCLDLGFLDEKAYSALELKRGEVGFLLSQFIRALQK